MGSLKSSPFTLALLGWGACYGGPTGGDDPSSTGGSGASAGESDGESGSGGDTDGDGDGTCSADSFAPMPTRVLTNVQYGNLLHAAFPDAPLAALATLPPDTVTGGFVSGGAVVDEIRLDAFFEVAQSVSAYVADSFSRLVPGCPDSDDPACVHDFLIARAPILYRREVTERELDDLLTLFDRTNDDSRGIQYVTQALLLSGPFLYQVEPPAEERVAVGGTELASRLSLLFWDSAPSDDLLAAAEAGELDTEAGVRAWADLMLDDPAAAPVVRSFHDQWLALDERSDDGNLSAAASDELAAFVEMVTLGHDATFSDLFTSPRAHLDGTMADLYGVSDMDTEWIELQTGERAGLLTRAAFLLQDGPQTSPTPRGQRVRTKLLCQDTPPVPGDVDFPPFMDDLTPREFVEYHLNEPVCASCHRFLDPIGLAFEPYDQTGRFRTEYAIRPGEAIDPAGDIAPLPGQPTDVDGPFASVLELGEKMASSESIRRCYLQKWYRFTVGRPLNDADACEIQRLDQAFVDGGSRPRDLLVELVASPAFRFRDPTP